MYKTFPALKEHSISQTTIRRLFQAPNKHFRAAERYTAFINARVGTKINTYREFHQDTQYLFARNKMRHKLSSLFPNDISILSVDDMAKIKVGAPAVSRYHQVKRLFLEKKK